MRLQLWFLSNRAYQDKQRISLFQPPVIPGRLYLLTAGIRRQFFDIPPIDLAALSGVLNMVLLPVVLVLYQDAKDLYYQYQFVFFESQAVNFVMPAGYFH